jgi:hypothetical protein
LNVEEETEQEIKSKETPKAPEQASQPRGIETYGTVDTVDDEHHHRAAAADDDNDVKDTTSNTVVDHMAKFKQGLHDNHGTPMIAEASAMETTKTMEEDESLTDESNTESNNIIVPSIFRKTTKNNDVLDQKDDVVITDPDLEKKDRADEEVLSWKESNKTGATLMMIWLTCILFVLCVQTQTPSNNMTLSGSYYYGNVLCSPIRPGKTLDASLLAADNKMDEKKNHIVSTMTIAAPWWAPELIQETVFDYVCNTRPRTILNAEVHTKKRRGGDYLNFMSVTIKDSDPRKKKPLLKLNRKKSIGVDPTGEKILVENWKGKQGITEFGAPWALP